MAETRKGKLSWKKKRANRGRKPAKSITRKSLKTSNK
jgi:hypothetical protein